MHFPVSQLRFPLNVWMAFVNADVTIIEYLSLKLNGKININRGSGKMEDSDWGYWYLDGNASASTSTLDIYSESDSNLMAAIIDFRLLYQLVQVNDFYLHAGGGFLYQRFEFDISNLNQWYPSHQQYSAYLSANYPTADYSAHDLVAGKVMTYRVTYYIPYIQIAADFDVSSILRLSGSMELSPYVMARDVDDHILRSKEGKGESTGSMAAFKFAAKQKLTPDIFLCVSLNYMLIKTEGTQVQSYYAPNSDGKPVGYYGTIDNELESRQISFGFSAGYSF